MSDYKKAVMAILTVDVFWGINTVVSKIVLDEVPILTFLGLRSVIAALFLGLLFRKSFVRPPLKLLALTFMGGPIVFYGSWYGISISNATSISLVGAIDPSMYFFFSVLFLHEAFSPRKLAGVLLAVTGVAIGAIVGGCFFRRGSMVWASNIFIFPSLWNAY